MNYTFPATIHGWRGAKEVSSTGRCDVIDDEAVVRFTALPDMVDWAVVKLHHPTAGMVEMPISSTMPTYRAVDLMFPIKVSVL